MEVVASRYIQEMRGHVSLYCPACKQPCAALIYVSRGNNRLSTLVGINDDLNEYCTVQRFWPEPPIPLVAEHLPAPVEKSVVQAERNFDQLGNEEASAMMYRRAMETALKLRFPDVGGSLMRQIETLVETHAIPAEMGEWAHEIRLAGNEAAHDEDGVSRESLTAIRNFCDTLLRYVFTLPKEIELRRAARVVAEARG